MHHYTYSPAVNVVVVLSLALFTVTLGVIVRDRIRAWRRGR